MKSNSQSCWEKACFHSRNKSSNSCPYISYPLWSKQIFHNLIFQFGQFFNTFSQVSHLGKPYITKYKTEIALITANAKNGSNNSTNNYISHNLLYATDLCIYHLKTSEILRFFDVFRAYKKRNLWHGMV